MKALRVPLIFVVRIETTLRAHHARDHLVLPIPKVLPILLIGLLLHAAGEPAGRTRRSLAGVAGHGRAVRDEAGC